MDLDAVPPITTRLDGGLLVAGARVLQVERIGDLALLTVEVEDDADPGARRPYAYLLRAYALPGASHDAA